MIKPKGDDVVFQLLYSNQPSLVGILSILRRFEKRKPFCKSHQDFFQPRIPVFFFFQVVSVACPGVSTFKATIEIEPMMGVFWPKITRSPGVSDQESNLDSSVRSVKNGLSIKTNNKLKIIEVTLKFQ